MFCVLNPDLASVTVNSQWLSEWMEKKKGQVRSWGGEKRVHTSQTTVSVPGRHPKSLPKKEKKRGEKTFEVKEVCDEPT